MDRKKQILKDLFPITPDELGMQVTKADVTPFTLEELDNAITTVKPAIVVSRCVVHRIFLAYYKTYKEGNKDIHLFQLPEDEVIRNKWIAQIGGQEVLRRATRVCNIHFDVCYFKSMYRNRIEKDAIPTLFLAVSQFSFKETKQKLIRCTHQKQEELYIYPETTPSTAEPPLKRSKKDDTNNLKTDKQISIKIHVVHSSLSNPECNSGCLEEVLQFGESLEYMEHDDIVVVFMLGGVLTSWWRQPVEYFFCRSSLNASAIIFKGIVKGAESAHLKVIASVCDKASTNVQAIPMLLDATKRTAVF
ncbi:THAP domain [Popillia japonica]|uniref:THAP domain n=1 Tax=Popillia japonica TaxID=7064 RepID=A0AAW1JG79_POPJA